MCSQKECFCDRLELIKITSNFLFEDSWDFVWKKKNANESNYYRYVEKFQNNNIQLKTALQNSFISNIQPNTDFDQRSIWSITSTTYYLPTDYRKL